MPSFNNPVADARDAHEAARGLAHATRQVEDPRVIYTVLGSLSALLASTSQVLHQLGAAHDRMPTTGVPAPAGRNARATSYQVAWELHRAAEMLNHISAAVDRAHQLEAAITYDVHLPIPPAANRRGSGLSR